ncbi:MAG: metal-dependent transcriptional regulator [Caldisericia bacterium]|nr:metal-dependent transcriptional regulator [Caldisericia bacterium]
MNTELSASLEDYLEAIAILSQENELVRCSNIGVHLKVKKSSVTNALRHLYKMNLINYTPYKPIKLTQTGKQIAVEILKKHVTIREFFVNVLGIGDAKADEAACKIEHAIGKEITDKLVEFVRDYKGEQNEA